MSTENTSVTRTQTRFRSNRTRYLLLALFAVLAAGFSVYGLTHLFWAPPPQAIIIAVATSPSGPQEKRGTATLHAVRLYFNDINRAGGIQGHPLEIVPYDDEGKAETAAEKAKQIAASPAIAVIGHYLSATSLAAARIYKAGAIPAITASASAPGLTTKNPYYFRIAIDNSSQGHTLAAYAKNVLRQKRARIIYSTAGVTWLLVYQNPRDPVKARKLVTFLRWAETEGQKMANELNYAPPPESVATRVLREIEEIMPEPSRQ